MAAITVDDQSKDVMISRRKLQQLQQSVRATNKFKEVAESTIHAGQNWDFFDYQQPAYVSDPRIGPCLVHAVGIDDTNRGRLLIYPVTIGDVQHPGLGRDKWYSVPRMVVVNDEMQSLAYIYMLDALIKNAAIVEGDANVGKSNLTIYEVVHTKDQPDSARTRIMTLDELQKEIASGNLTYKMALDIFTQSNIPLAKRISFLSTHEVSPDADQFIIGAPIRKERLDKWSLAPHFLQAHLRALHSKK